MVDNTATGKTAGSETSGAAEPPPPTAEAQPGEATLLVSEFPPPPFYYRQIMGGAGATSSSSLPEPPPIPYEALAKGTQRAAAAAEKVRAESERIRMGESQDAILAGTATTAKAEQEDEDEAGGGVVAIFGEIVEDPLLIKPQDPCEDPRVVRDEVKRLNNEVVSGFVQLVQDLVHRPMDNKKTRDELSHNVFLMLQECNKFREHQARETLIELLEEELEARKRLLVEMQESIAEVDELLLN